MSARTCLRCAPSGAISTVPVVWSNCPTASMRETASSIRWNASAMTDLERRTALALLAAAAAGATISGDAKADTQMPRDATLCPEVLGKFLRVAKPGEAMTMEYRADRLTIEVDEKNRIKAIRTG